MKTFKFVGVQESYHLPLNVAVIGNSPNLLKSKNGPIIDSFDSVIRFNSAIVNGYETHVGQKTSIVCLGLDIGYFFSYPYVRPQGDITRSDSPNRLQNALILSALYPQTDFITWAVESERAKKNYQHLNAKILADAGCEKRTYHWFPERDPFEIKDNYQGNRILEELEIQTRLASGKGMRTGFRIVLMLLKSGITPHLFGFDLDKFQETVKHYCDEVTREKMDNPSHDFIGEMTALDELEKKNKIRVYS